MIQGFNCLVDQNDWRLILLATLVCVFACLTTTALLTRSSANTGPRAWAWTIAAAVMFGLGVWTLHFVSMLSFMPGMRIAYSIAGVTRSVASAVGGAALAFTLRRYTRATLAAEGAAGLLMGLSVFGMHWAGFDAMRAAEPFGVDALPVAMSVVCGVVLAILALHRARDMVRLSDRIKVAGLFALSICSMHFVGMAALHPGHATAATALEPGGPGQVLASRGLAILVGCTGLLILVATLIASLVDQLRSEHAVRELHHMRMLNDLSREVLIIARDDRVVEVNAAGRKLFGRPFAEMIGRDPTDLFADDGFRLSPTEDGVHEANIVGPDGDLIPVELSTNDIELDGKPASLFVMADLSGRKRAEKRIRHLAHHDSLTDLPNRVLLSERLTIAMARAARDSGSVALLYLDLDRFKPVNDMHGHAVGDALLTEVARRLRRAGHDADTLARIGGDEFIVLASVEHADAVAALATGLIEAVRRPYRLLGRLIEIGVSVGIALYPRDGTDADALMAAADTALYRAKEDRGTFRFFSPDMDRHGAAARSFEGDLQQAIHRNELRLVYRPIAELRTRTLTGYEALLEWRHPATGSFELLDATLPTTYTDLTTTLESWTLETACREASHWAKPWRVAVTVSAATFREPDFGERLIDLMATTGLRPRRLEIAITESIMLENEARALETLGALRRLGVGIALHSFGTGFSSLNALRNFPYDRLKIDSSLVSGLGHDAGAGLIVRTIIGLARSFGVGTIAEGVGTAEQLDFLGREGCDEVQGPWFGPQVEL